MTEMFLPELALLLLGDELLADLLGAARNALGVLRPVVQIVIVRSCSERATHFFIFKEALP